MSVLSATFDKPVQGCTHLVLTKGLTRPDATGWVARHFIGTRSEDTHIALCNCTGHVYSVDAQAVSHCCIRAAQHMGAARVFLLRCKTQGFCFFSKPTQSRFKMHSPGNYAWLSFPKPASPLLVVAP